MWEAKTVIHAAKTSLNPNRGIEFYNRHDTRNLSA